MSPNKDEFCKSFGKKYIYIYIYTFKYKKSPPKFLALNLKIYILSLASPIYEEVVEYMNTYMKRWLNIYERKHAFSRT
jgi:FMN-dependent NADH-azoreductase